MLSMSPIARAKDRPSSNRLTSCRRREGRLPTLRDLGLATPVALIGDLAVFAREGSLGWLHYLPFQAHDMTPESRANFGELRQGEVVRRTPLLGTSVNKGPKLLVPCLGPV